MFFFSGPGLGCMSFDKIMCIATPCGKEEKVNEQYPCELCVVLCGFFLCTTFI